ncbi:hypothetical protein ABZT03_36355 [Streptomyces sp. NPDC005574]|uniref:hypothetical protein n=1 Tax=Streptomyces sp. NPDC005574 TaxID=3156891 RepID=UPI0033AEDF40
MDADPVDVRQMHAGVGDALDRCGGLAAWGATYARLPKETYPHIAASTAALEDTMSRSAYPGALELLLEGLEQALHRLR